MAWDAIQTKPNITTPKGIVSTLRSADPSIAPTCTMANPSMPGMAPDAAVLPPSSILETPAIVNGTTAPAATRPLVLFSTSSSRSRGFLSPGGTAVPNASFAAHAPTMSKAGTKNSQWAYQGSAARAASSFAFIH